MRLKAREIRITYLMVMTISSTGMSAVTVPRARCWIAVSVRISGLELKQGLYKVETRNYFNRNTGTCNRNYAIHYYHRKERKQNL